MAKNTKMNIEEFIEAIWHCSAGLSSRTYSNNDSERNIISMATSDLEKRLLDKNTAWMGESEFDNYIRPYMEQWFNDYIES